VFPNETNMINSVQKLDEVNKLIWHRRLGHFYHQNLEKYLELHNIKESIYCKEFGRNRLQITKYTKYFKHVIKKFLY